MSAAKSGYTQAVDRKTEWETRLEHAAEEILGVYQDQFFWHRMSEFANAGLPGREYETDSLVTVLNDIIAHPHDLVVGEHTGMQLGVRGPSTQPQ